MGTNFICLICYGENMNKYRFRCRTILTTFTLGLVCVWLSNYLKTNEMNLQEVRFVSIAPKQPRFTETFRGCGLGYVQGYVTNDDINLTAGNIGCEKPNSNDKRIVRSNKGRIVSRIKKDDQTYYQIYQVEKGYCINSPTIELGIELENYLKSNSE